MYMGLRAGMGVEPKSIHCGNNITTLNNSGYGFHGSAPPTPLPLPHFKRKVFYSSDVYSCYLYEAY